MKPCQGSRTIAMVFSRKDSQRMLNCCIPYVVVGTESGEEVGNESSEYEAR
ncbi:hypothetical protein B7P43_G04226 [Cryptotermes secundus]|uniref:Uncharacterized protein n=1 Tax=Cryptotermes secundus TaxID=105785 RepID=A0A2J7RSQ9_9NEOP|nr:hypothetical protein B7P43_G04226 [Cryptotermes secundus]